MNDNRTVVSLFSGAGGMSLGFARAGLKPSLGVDVERDACDTYESNLNVQCHNLDIAADTAELARTFKGYGDVFCVIGGPPCQGFSTAGDRTGKDPRNRLIFNYLWVVQETQPKWFLFENVEGLLTSKGGESVTALVRQLMKLGYTLRLEKANFAGYGLPQTRKRVVLVGNRVGWDFTLPAYTHSFNSGKHKIRSNLPPSPTVGEAIGGLGLPATNSSVQVPYGATEAVNAYEQMLRTGNDRGTVSGHYSSPTSGAVERYRLLAPGQSMKDLPEHLRHESYGRRANRRVADGTPTEKRGGAPSGIKRLSAELNCLTITGGSTRELIHPYEDRPLTIRECARIQSFPDWYEFRGGAASITRQIGNAFPPMVATIYANWLRDLDGSAGADTGPTPRSGRARLLGFRLTEAYGMSPALKQTERMLSELEPIQEILDLNLDSTEQLSNAG